MSRLLWLPALLLIVTTAYAEEVPYRMFTVSDGLPNEDIHALAQTADGRLYVGTPGGLSVYNGQQFRQVPLPDSVRPASIYHLVEADNTVWAATGSGWVMEVRAGRVTRVLPELRSIERLLLRRDTLHIVCKRSYRILPPGAERPLQQRLGVSFRMQDSPTLPQARSLADADVGPKGHLWVLDRRLGPGKLQPNGSVTFTDVPSGSDSKGWWNHLRFGPDGTALLQGRQTIYRFDPATGGLTTIPAVNRGESFYFNRGIAYVPSPSGVARLEWADAGKPNVLSSLDRQLGLPNVQARCVLRDHEGGLWVGTRGGLMHLFAPDVRHISRIDDTPLVYVGHFIRDARDALWANTWGSGLLRLRPRRARFTPGSASHWPTVDSRDGALHALSERGWFRREPGEGWQKVAPQNGAVRGYVNAEGVAYFWHNRGLYRHDPDPSSSPMRLFSWKASENGKHAHTLAPNGDVVLWAKGVLLRGTVPDAPASSVQFDTLAVLSDEFAADGVRYMAFDTHGTAWLAFWHLGLVRVETAGEAARVQTVLPDHPMIDVTLSGDSLVFAGARDGLYVIDQRDGSLRRHLTAADGLLATTTQSAVIHGDTLYASHPRGVTVMPLPSLFRPRAPPKVLLTRVERASQTEGLRAPRRFEAGDRTVGFGFAAATFKNPERVRYAYRLRPHDTTWTVSPEGFTRYVDLPPGTHRFEVRARRANSTFGDAATYTFTIPPHFYETTWFRLLGLLVLGLAGLGVYRWRVMALRRRQRELKQTVANRTEQLRNEKRKTEKQAERLAELDAAKNRFFANLSHEFRTPLTLILQPLNDALKGAFGALPEPLRNQLRLMRRNARRLQRLISQLLDLTRLEAGRMTLRRRPGDLVAFTRDLVEAFTPMAEREQVALHFHPEPDRLQVSFDPNKLEQVLGNLLSNALKYTPEGGKVWVAVSHSDSGDSSTAEIVVKDTGPGLTEEELRRIFDRFEQAGQTERTEHDGLGVGLALAKELVDLHEGTLRAESEPGLGTAFTVHLPIREEEIEPTERDAGDSVAASTEASVHGGVPLIIEGEGPGPNKDEQMPGSKRDSSSGSSTPTLLIVEDEADVRSYLRRHLAGDYRVLEAEDGTVGLRVARDVEPDLIVSDVMMPEMDGTELCEAVKSDDDLASTPVLLLTAKAAPSDAIEGLDRGADDYLTKPFDIGELRARIDRLLAMCEQFRTRFSETVQVEPTGATTSKDTKPFLQEVLDVAESHLSDTQFTAGGLAAEMALSQRQLTRRLKKVTGETPAAFLRRLRLERAARLLRDDTQTVAETAYAVGYNSPSHFAKVFRKRFGCPPSEYSEDDS